MATPEELAAQTDEAAEGPKRMKVRDHETEQHSLPDRIALEKHRAANTQAASSSRLLFNKISPPGSA